MSARAELKKYILRKCRQRVLDEYEEEEEALEEIEERESEGVELPFDDILAEKRRQYSAADEFIYLLYNDILRYFIDGWEGTYIRKKPRMVDDDSVKEASHFDENYDNSDYNDTISNNLDEASNTGSNKSDKWPWRLILRDELAKVKFINNNSYNGRVSRKMMEGEGVYRWNNGAQYKGEFERNLMHGKGLLEWNSVCWYEGNFLDGYRHGRGIMVDSENRYMYTGEWFKGRRHGKGYSRYGDDGSYDGDWLMDKMHGVGMRIYKSGSRYLGGWKNGVRDGTGTMVWSDGSVYRGEWRCGAMSGYGEYVWNGFFNKTFTWPQEAFYKGYWERGTRHGRGEIGLNSVGGAKYYGYWKYNKKHGYGVIIGNNGEKFESDALFLNDILCVRDNPENESKSEIKSEQGSEHTPKEAKSEFLDRPETLTDIPATPILRPEQFPCLYYYIRRLLDPDSLHKPSVSTMSSGKCYSCENELCSCLAHPTETETDDSELKDPSTDTLTYSKDLSTGSNYWKFEEQWIYNCITLHMPRLRKIYNDYAKLFAEESPNCNLKMTRFHLWQLWRDCGIHKKGFSLNEIDNHIAKTDTALVKDPVDPFEKIEIWQYLHALLEVSWHLYTKDNEIMEIDDMNGKIAAGLHKLLNNDIYPNAGSRVGNICNENQDLLPIYCVYELYKQIGYPPTAKDLLCSTRISENPVGDTQSSSSINISDVDTSFPEGVNYVALRDRVEYLLKFDEIFTNINRFTYDPPKQTNGLLIFKHLETRKMIDIMASVCPPIKDMNSGIITNMEYKLTFLEFYEILLEAARQLLLLKKKLEEKNEMSKYVNNNSREDGIGDSNTKDTKTKNRSVT